MKHTINTRKYEGVDADIETSLFEYGLIWAKGIKDHENDYHFIYAVGGNDEGYNKFDWADIAIDTNPEKEWDWADFDKVSECAGLDKDDFLKQGLPQIVYDLVFYYGYENVFGSSYYPFEVELV